MSYFPDSYSQYDIEKLKCLNNEIESADCSQIIGDVYTAYEKWLRRLESLRNFNGKDIKVLIEENVSISENLDNDEVFHAISSVFKFIGFCRVIDSDSNDTLKVLTDIRESIKGFIYVVVQEEDLPKVYSIIIRDVGFPIKKFPSSQEEVYTFVVDCLVDFLWQDTVSKAEKKVSAFYANLVKSKDEEPVLEVKRNIAKKKAIVKKDAVPKKKKRSIWFDEVLASEDGLDDTALEDAVNPHERYASKEEMIEEAIARMKYLEFDEEIIDNFRKGAILLRTPYGKDLYQVSKESIKRIREVEEKYGLIVYFVLSGFNGDYYDYCVYVSKYKDEWKTEHNINAKGIASIYGISYADNAFSEYGSIYIMKDSGSITENTDFRDAILYGK